MPGEGDFALRLALVVAAILGAFSLLLMLQILVVAQAGARRSQRREIFRETWRPLLAAESLGMASQSPPQSPRRDDERRWWLQLWSQMQATLRGEAHARLNRLLCALELDRHALELLARRDMRGQLIALACLRHLADPAHWTLLESVLRSRSPIKALAAAEALVAIDPARAMRQLLPLAMRRRDWAQNRLGWLCRLAGPAAVTPPLAELLRRPENPQAAARLHALVPYADARELAPWARRVLDERVTEAPARAAALGVLCRLRDPADHARIVDSARHSDPTVRLAAAAALRAQARVDDAPRFLPLLDDRDWSVRQEAASALATLPGLADDALQAMAAGVMDRYGREALQRAMAERTA